MVAKWFEIRLRFHDLLNFPIAEPWKIGNFLLATKYDSSLIIYVNQILKISKLNLEFVLESRFFDPEPVWIFYIIANLD